MESDKQRYVAYVIFFLIAALVAWSIYRGFYLGPASSN